MDSTHSSDSDSTSTSKVKEVTAKAAAKASAKGKANPKPKEKKTTKSKEKADLPERHLTLVHSSDSDSSSTSEVTALPGDKKVTAKAASKGKAKAKEKATKKRKEKAELPKRKLTLDDVKYENDVPISICDIKTSELTVAHLRKCCKDYSVKNYKSKVLVDLYAMVVARLVTLHNYPEDEDTTSRKARQTPGCIFRLVNILMSDTYRAKLGDLGNREQDHHKMDNGTLKHDIEFWTPVQKTFRESTEDAICGLQTFDDAFLIGKEEDFDPSEVVPHDWDKLRAMWLKLQSSYKAVWANFTKSGNNQQFIEYSKDQLDVYYLYKWLQIHGESTASILAELPKGAQISTASGFAAIVSPRAAERESSRATKKSKVDNANDSVKEFAEAKTKYLELETERQQAETVCKQAEEARKNAKAQRREYLDKKAEHEKSRAVIDRLMQQIEAATNGDIKADLEDDLEMEMERKKLLKAYLKAHMSD